MKTKSFIIGAFYTPEYEKELQKLKDSCHQFDYSYWFQEYLSTGNWQKNTYIKPEFILYMLNNYDEDILYLDADAIIKQPLNFFEQGIKGDMSMFIVPKNKRDGKVWPRTEAYCYLSGTMYFKNNERSKKFVTAWLKKREKYPKLAGDQALIPYVLREDNLDLEITPLPIEYVKIFDKRVPCGEPVIIHYQASRRLKRKIKMDNLKRTVGNYQYRTDKEEVKYDELHKEDKVPTVCKEFAPWIALRLQIDKPNILDIGCGKAELRYHIPFTTYTGLDIAKEVIEGLRKNAKENEIFLHGDVAQINTEQPFDVVICLNTLQHLPEDLVFDALERIKKISDTQVISVNCKRSKILSNDRSSLNLTIQPSRWWADTISTVLDIKERKETDNDIIFFCGKNYHDPNAVIEIPFKVRHYPDGGVWLARRDRKKEEFLDQLMNRVPNQLKWYPRIDDELNVANLANIAEGKCVYIIGKGPSLDNTSADLFLDDGPVIAINESVNHIQDLPGLKNRVFLLQQDAGLSCNPSGPIILNDRIKHLHPSIKERFLFNKHSFNDPSDPLSVIAAIRVAKIMGAEEIVLIAFDASINQNTSYAKVIGHPPNTVGGRDAARFLSHKAQMLKALGRTKVSWLTPLRPVQNTSSDKLRL